MRFFMNIQSINQLNQYLFAQQNPGQFRAGNVSNLENYSSQSLQLKITQFQLETVNFSSKEVNEQAQLYEFSLSASRLDITLTDIATSENKQDTREQSNSFFDENGYWGIAQTSQRLANFVLAGAGDDINKLRQGREGILQGFKEAEQIWGGQLPQISYKTINSALEQIDSRIHDLGKPIIDVAA